jgi:hypothetical protein
VGRAPSHHRHLQGRQRLAHHGYIATATQLGSFGSASQLVVTNGTLALFNANGVSTVGAFITLLPDFYVEAA